MMAHLAVAMASCSCCCSPTQPVTSRPAVSVAAWRKPRTLELRAGGQRGRGGGVGGGGGRAAGMGMGWARAVHRARPNNRAPSGAAWTCIQSCSSKVDARVVDALATASKLEQLGQLQLGSCSQGVHQQRQESRQLQLGQLQLGLLQLQLPRGYSWVSTNSVKTFSIPHSPARARLLRTPLQSRTSTRPAIQLAARRHNGHGCRARTPGRLPLQNTHPPAHPPTS